MTDEAAPPPEEPKGVGLDSHRSDEAIYEPFNPGPLGVGMAEDGLPTIEPPTGETHAPPLHPKTMVCIADKSSFVTRNQWGEVTAEFRPEEVSRAPNGDYYVSAPLALTRAKDLTSETLAARCVPVSGKLGNYYVYEFDEDDKQTGVEIPVPGDDVNAAGRITLLRHAELARKRARIRVEPVRPQCKFLRRQMTDFQDASDNQLVERLCTARRDSESFFLSLRDQQVHACELREPRHGESEARLDRFDDAKIKLGRERYEDGGAFDVDAALTRTEEQADRGMSYGGIFKSSKD